MKRPGRYALFLLMSCIFLIQSMVSFSQDQKIVYDSAYLASVSDSINRYYLKHPRKLVSRDKKFNVIPYYGINYSQESSAGVNAGFAGLYRNSTDSLVPYSAIAVILGASINSTFIGRVKGTNYSPHGHFALGYSVRYGYLPRSFWGVGYTSADNGSNKSSFIEQTVSVTTEYLYRRGNELQAGPVLGYEYIKYTEPSRPSLLEGELTSSQPIKAGARVEYDTRDDYVSPTEGIVLKAEQMYYYDLNNAVPFYSTSVSGDFYFPGWEGCVFALDITGDFSYGDSPWMMWPTIGGDSRMRGYYEGRYREKNIITGQFEIRQDIYKGHGVAVWGGAANLFRSADAFDITQTLPTWGFGYRLKLFGFIVRIDAGFGKAGQYAISAGINQAF